MRKVDWLHYTSSRQLVNHLHEINLITQPFSDGDIFDLQEKFLTNGFQYLKAENIQKGRAIIDAFLNSLGLYHEIACLTVSNMPLSGNTADLYYELNAGNFLNSFEPSYLDEFFFDQFYYDFMWIEATRKLLMSGWFEDVKKRMINMAIDQHIPIIVIVYSE